MALSLCAVQAQVTAVGATPSAPGSAHVTRLCSSTKTVSRLVVRRRDAYPQNHVRFSFPSSVVAKGPAAARTVARAVCALPPLPTQTMHCPMDLGITYHLTFSHARRRIGEVVLDATGCEAVHGLVRPRWVAHSPSFWRVLGTALGLRNPSWTTFRGTPPHG